MQLPELPLLKVVVQRYAEVVDELDLTPGEQALILPTNEWFPDRFTGDQASFEALVARMQGYAGLEEIELEAQLVGADGSPACGPSGCGPSGCGTPKPTAEGPRLSATRQGFLLEMPAAAVSQPIAFTASVARALGQIRLVKAGDTSGDPMRAELAATALGFGVLLMEASYLYSKSCGGPSVGTATALSCGELAVPLALFLACEGHKPRAAVGELSTTQRAVFDDAWALVSSNRSLIESLRSRPDRVKEGRFELGEARSWLARLFAGKKAAPPAAPELVALAALERGESVENVAALLGTAPTTTTRGPARSKPPSDDIDDLVGEALAELRNEPAARSAAE